jgi:hypothetical protein
VIWHGCHPFYLHWSEEAALILIILFQQELRQGAQPAGSHTPVASAAGGAMCEVLAAIGTRSAIALASLWIFDQIVGQFRQWV